MQYTKLFDHVIRMHSYNNISLSLLARNIYCDFAALDANGLAIYPSNGYIAEKYGVNERTVMRAIQELQKSGLVKGTIRKNTTKLYTLLVRPEDLVVAKAKVEATAKVDVVEIESEVVVVPVLEEVTTITAEEFLAQVQETVTTSAEEFLAKMEATPVKSMSAEEFLASMVQVKKEEVTPSVTAEDFLAAMAVSTITAESFLASRTIH